MKYQESNNGWKQNKFKLKNIPLFLVNKKKKKEFLAITFLMNKPFEKIMI